MTAPVDIAFSLNGDAKTASVPAHMLLIDFLRETCNLRGTKRSCDMQICGACTVLVDENPVSSCTTLAVDIDGTEVTTIEGLGGPDGLDPVQQAFLDHNALQCGFCTPGFILSVKALLRANPTPSHDEIIHHLNGNLCRCTGYHKITHAVESLVRPRGSNETHGTPTIPYPGFPAGEGSQAMRDHRQGPSTPRETGIRDPEGGLPSAPAALRAACDGPASGRDERLTDELGKPS